MSSRFSSTTRWRILPSAAPRNSTPCGATAAIRPFTDRLAIMWSRNAQSPLLAVGTPQSNRWNLSSDASILNSFLPFPEDSPPGLKPDAHLSLENGILATIASNSSRFPSASRNTGLARVSPQPIFASRISWMYIFIFAMATEEPLTSCP